MNQRWKKKSLQLDGTRVCGVDTRYRRIHNKKKKQIQIWTDVLDTIYKEKCDGHSTILWSLSVTRKTYTQVFALLYLVLSCLDNESMFKVQRDVRAKVGSIPNVICPKPPSASPASAGKTCRWPQKICRAKHPAKRRRDEIPQQLTNVSAVDIIVPILLIHLIDRIKANYQHVHRWMTLCYYINKHKLSKMKNMFAKIFHWLTTPVFHGSICIRL
jgi:hypothetical protein